MSEVTYVRNKAYKEMKTVCIHGPSDTRYDFYENKWVGVYSRYTRDVEMFKKDPNFEVKEDIVEKTVSNVVDAVKEVVKKKK